jgi:TPP-dependent pyruvate/acetoin dehydrogenase alpha subunit
MGTAIQRHQSQTSIARKADAYALPAATVDGMDVLAVQAATRRAAEHVRSGEGPFLLEAQTYRFRAHLMYDAELYRSKEEVERWKQRDPIALFETRLRDWGLLSDAERASIENAVAATIAEAVAFAEAGPWEPVEDLTRDVYTSPILTPAHERRNQS